MKESRSVDGAEQRLRWLNGELDRLAREVESPVALTGDRIKVIRALSDERARLMSAGVRVYCAPPTPMSDSTVSQINRGDRESFLRSYEWQTVRMRALTKYGPRCQCCGATPAHGAKIVVDHIKPRIRFPELALDINNLQILCAECNQGKSNWDETDWRHQEGEE